MRFCEISLPANAVKLWAKKLCLRSREMMPGSRSCRRGRRRWWRARCRWPRASLRNSASQRSKLPVFWQLALAAAPWLGSAAAGAAAVADQQHDRYRCQLRRRLAHECRLPMRSEDHGGGANEGSRAPSSSASRFELCWRNCGTRMARAAHAGSRWPWAKLESAQERGLGRGEAGDRLAVGRVRLDEGVGLRLLLRLLDLQHSVVDRGARHSSG